MNQNNTTPSADVVQTLRAISSEDTQRSYQAKQAEQNASIRDGFKAAATNFIIKGGNDPTAFLQLSSAIMKAFFRAGDNLLGSARPRPTTSASGPGLGAAGPTAEGPA